MKSRSLSRVIACTVALIMVMGSLIPGFALEKGERVETEDIRLSGDNRYETAFAIADELYKAGGAFDNVVVAYGQNYPDALSGGYLARQKNAPILLINAHQEDAVFKYIQDHMKKDGTVYLLGGEGVVSFSFGTRLKEAGYTVSRLGGKTRIITNLIILQHVFKGNEDMDCLLIARSDNFPDALSGSAVDIPIMLVGEELEESQIEFITGHAINNYYILGGTGAVSEKVEDTLKIYAIPNYKRDGGSLERLAGANRWETSAMIADKFFDDADTVVLATGRNFPDALAGAPIANKNNAPILLVAPGNTSYAHEYVVDNEVRKSISVGGEAIVSNETVDVVMEQYAANDEEDQDDEEDTEEGGAETGTEMVNDFTVNMFQAAVSNPPVSLDKGMSLQSNSSDKNILISPLSVLYAMSMTANGAEGKTLEEMEKVLGCGLDQEEINSYLQYYLGEIADSEDIISIANSLWIADDEELKVEEQFIQENTEGYKAGVFKTVFDEAARLRVNAWIEEHTGETIKDMLQELSEDTVMLLVNALAFEAKWRIPYNKNQVATGTFYGSAGNKDVTFMTSSEKQYLKDDDAQGFLKNYEGGRYAFAALLPNEDVDIDSYIEGLTGDRLTEILSEPVQHSVITKTPKFETESSMNLNEVLISLGIKEAFDGEKADFSRLGTYADGNRNLFIGKVLHKTYMDVNESGTKAGAATVVEMEKNTAIIEEEPPYEVTLNRPFIYMIIDKEENIPLFIGVMRNI